MSTTGGALAGRVALVTGASRGIGRAIARRFAREGAVLVVSARTGGALEVLADEVRGGGGQVHTVVADSAERHGAGEIVRHALGELGRVDVLVNNVGGIVGADNDPYAGDDGSFEATLALTLLSAWWTSSAALPAMRDQGGGRIVNIGSGASIRASRLAYTTAKHGLVGLTRSLAAATALDGITVNCLCPGWVRTSYRWDRIAELEGTTPEEARQWAEGESAQRRILEPDELTGMATLLASAEGGGITGQVVNVDGGYRL